MRAPRLVGLVVALLAGGACVPRGGTQAPGPVQRDDGPKASIYAQYSGGIVMRTVNVSFRVNQSAFVVVGHLGGDGVIRVLYPDSPNNFGQLMSPVRPNKTVATRPFFAGYDGAPSLYTFSMTPFRNTGAMFDSYDGRGHGFIFMIASSSPMDLERIMDGDEWAEVAVQGYHRISDPRLAIRRYAQELAGSTYTLKFANSFTTQGFQTYAASAWDCSVLSSLGLFQMHSFWGNWGMPNLWSYEYGSRNSFARSGCAPLHYASIYGYNDFYGRQRQVFAPQLTPTMPPTLGPTTPTTSRPTYRPFGERATTPGTATLSRTIPTTRGSGIDRSGSSWPTSDDSRPSVRSRGGPVYRPVDGQRFHSPRGSLGSPNVSIDRPSSRSPGPSTSAAPAPRPSSPAPSSTPATRTTTSTTTTTKHQ